MTYNAHLRFLHQQQQLQLLLRHPLQQRHLLAALDRSPLRTCFWLRTWAEPSSPRVEAPLRGGAESVPPANERRASTTRTPQPIGRTPRVARQPTVQSGGEWRGEAPTPQERREDGSSEDRGNCGRRSEIGLVWTSFSGGRVIVATAAGSADGRGRGWSGLRSFGGQVW